MSPHGRQNVGEDRCDCFCLYRFVDNSHYHGQEARRSLRFWQIPWLDIAITVTTGSATLPLLR